MLNSRQNFLKKKHCTKATCYGVVTTWFMSMFHSEMFSQGSPFCDWSFSLTSHLILLLERSREKFTGFNAVTQHNSTIHSVLKTKKSSIWGSHTVYLEKTKFNGIREKKVQSTIYVNLFIYNNWATRVEHIFFNVCTILSKYRAMCCLP